MKPCTALDLMWYYLAAKSELHTLRGFAVNGVQAIIVSFNCEIVSQNDVIGEHLFFSWERSDLELCAEINGVDFILLRCVCLGL